MKHPAMLFTGNANRELSAKISQVLDIPLGEAVIDRFSDGEHQVHIKESVRGKDVYVIQPTCPPDPSGYLMELLVIIDAIRRASASRIIAVIPYYGFARQDRRPYSVRVPITAKLVANMLVAAGANRILTVDLHAEQIQGFFDIPVDNLYGTHIIKDDIAVNYPNAMIVSPDVGGVLRARAVAKLLETELAIVDKRRPKANVSEVMHIIGDIEGRDCIIIDDMVDTAGTLCKAAEALKKDGAKKVMAYITHPLLSGNAVMNIKNSVIDELVVTDSIPLSDHATQCDKIRVITIADILAKTIHRIHHEESVSALMPGLQG